MKIRNRFNLALLLEFVLQISLGNLEIPEFREPGTQAIVQLQKAFNRMRRSIQKAMRAMQPFPDIAERGRVK